MKTQFLHEKKHRWMAGVNDNRCNEHLISVDIIKKSTQIKSLRRFPDGGRHCYNLLIAHARMNELKMKGAVVLGMTSLVIIFAVFLRSRSFIQPMRLMSLQIRNMRPNVLNNSVNPGMKQQTFFLFIKIAFLLLFCAWNLIRLTGVSIVSAPIVNATL